MKINIAFDLDATLVHIEQILIDVFEMFNLEYYPSPFFDMRTYPSNIREEIFRKFEDYRYMCNLQPVIGSIELIQKLQEIFNVYIITNRSRIIAEQTIKYVNRIFNIPEECVIINGLNNSKKDIILEKNIKCHIDDNSETIYSVSRIIHCILISNKHTEYNHYLANNCRYNELKNVKIFNNVVKTYNYLLSLYDNNFL